MKKIVKIPVIEVEGEGLVALLGKKVMLFCVNYIYTGVLSGVNTSVVLLDDAAVVYETGSFESKSFGDAQKIGKPLYVSISAIESFFETDKK